MEGLIPLVCSAIKKRRTRAGRYEYERLIPVGTARVARELAHFDGGAYQSQSCRFAVRRPSRADEFGFSHDDDRPPPEDISGELFPPASRKERGMSRSLRFSSFRVLACVGGA